MQNQTIITTDKECCKLTGPQAVAFVYPAVVNLGLFSHK